jgi:hypothetical protein
MVGVVTTRDLLVHPYLVVHEFGARCLLRCVWRTLTSDHEVTFLECVSVDARRQHRPAPTNADLG